MKTRLKKSFGEAAQLSVPDFAQKSASHRDRYSTLHCNLINVALEKTNSGFWIALFID
jgi:hypothetical protein